MTPDERKAIAMRQTVPPLSIPQAGICERFYPKCCTYHEGFDAALGLLVRSAVEVDGDIYYHIKPV